MNDLMLDDISSAIGTETGMVSIPRPEIAERTAEEDFHTARNNLRELIEQGMEAVPNMMMLMRDAQSDKLYNSGAAFLKMLADLNGQLLKQSKENVKGMPKMEVPQGSTVTNIQNNSTVYVGTTTELLREKRKRIAEEKAKELEQESQSSEEVIDGDYQEVINET